MDRVTVQYGQVPLETDLLQAERFAMVGLAKLAEAVLGTSSLVSGFTLVPTAPASLSATLGAGQIYEVENLEATAWSSLGVDTHSILKQGLALDPQTLTFVPPGTAGYAQYALVQATYADQDTGATVRPYYNAANPLVPFSGPGNSGSQDNTLRKGGVSVSIKYGIAATSGSQVAPTPDSGYVGMFVVALAYGQTTISAGQITAYTPSSFLPSTLPGIAAAIQSGKWVYGAASGTNTYSTTLFSTQAFSYARTVGMEILVLFANANTGVSTLNDGLGNAPIVKQGGGAVSSGDVSGFVSLIWDGANWKINGLAPSDVLALIQASQIGTENVVTFSAAGTFTYTPSAGTRAVMVEVLGAGGGGGGTNAPTSGTVGLAFGGGAGGYARKYMTIAQVGASATVVVGAAGAAGAASAAKGGNGGTSTFTPTGGGPTVSASGGSAGQNAGLVSAFPANTSCSSGGVGSGGDINIAGGGSLGSVAGSTGQALAGYAGSCIYGVAAAPWGSNGAGVVGSGYGSGGGAGLAFAGSVAQSGGPGAGGIVIVTEYK